MNVLQLNKEPRLLLLWAMSEHEQLSVRQSCSSISYETITLLLYLNVLEGMLVKMQLQKFGTEGGLPIQLLALICG